MTERQRFFVLGLVPQFCRSWPWLRRYYWQPDEVEAAMQEAREMSAWLKQHAQAPQAFGEEQ